MSSSDDFVDKVVLMAMAAYVRTITWLQSAEGQLTLYMVAAAIPPIVYIITLLMLGQ